MKTTYYYILEDLDTDGDIIETTAFDTLSMLVKHVQQHNILPELRNGLSTYALVRETHDGFELCDRGYAYEMQGAIPTKFDDGYSVPKRFSSVL
jgi:hypothetical protein